MYSLYAIEILSYNLIYTAHWIILLQKVCYKI